jgi:uncharacterized membrane protein YgcG
LIRPDFCRYLPSFSGGKKMKVLKYSPLLLLLLSGLFLVGCYTSLATRSHGDKYPDNGSYSNDNYNDNNDSYSSQDTSYNDDQGDQNIDNGPYPYYGRFYSHYYPSVAIGFGVGHFYDPFYWDPFFYDGWCAPYFYAYDPFFYYPYWGIAFGGGFHHGHGWNDAGYYKTRSRDGFALRNTGSRGSSYGVRGTLTRGAGIYSRNSDRTRLVNNGIITTRNPIDRSNLTTRNRNATVNPRSNAPNLRNRNDVVNPRSNAPNVRNRNNVSPPRSYAPNIRNRNDVGRNRQGPIVRDNRNGNGNYSRGNRPPQRTYNSPPQRNSSPTHSGNGSNRSNGSSNRGGGSGRSSGGGHSRR